VISGNSTGVLIEDQGVDPTGNVFAGNRIGTNAAGTVAVPNTAYGVRFQHTTITKTRFGTNADGVSDAAERNIISGNGSAGLSLFGTDSVVAGNYIGVGTDGTSKIANGVGVSLGGVSSGNRIGTNADGVNDAAERNVISGNAYGVNLALSGNTANTVAGNYI